MHVADGFLPAPVCIGGYAATGLMTWYSLRQIDRETDPRQGVPKAALLAAAFFVASSIRVPVPPASVHLVLNGMLGAVLGYFAFPAILVGLFFQAVMFGHGGLTTLGVNAIIMGVPALISYWLFSLRHRFEKETRWQLGVFAFLAGAIAVGLSTVLFYAIVVTNIPAQWNVDAERIAVGLLVLSHVPLMAIEGAFTTLLALFLQQVKPSLLES